MQFHKVGTKHKSYIQRFIKKYSNHDMFEPIKYDNHNIVLEADGVKVDQFNSNSTYKQFINTLICLGFIEVIPRGFKILNRSISFEVMTKYIFTKSDDKQVQRLRDSRKISLLAQLNLLNDKRIEELNIIKKHGEFNVNDAIFEASLWEELTLSTIGNVSHVLERIKNEFNI